MHLHFRTKRTLCMMSIWKQGLAIPSRVLISKTMCRTGSQAILICCSLSIVVWKCMNRCTGSYGTLVKFADSQSHLINGWIKEISNMISNYSITGWSCNSSQAKEGYCLFPEQNCCQHRIKSGHSFNSEKNKHCKKGQASQVLNSNQSKIIFYIKDWNLLCYLFC